VKTNIQRRKYTIIQVPFYNVYFPSVLYWSVPRTRNDEGSRKDPRHGWYLWRLTWPVRRSKIYRL